MTNLFPLLASRAVTSSLVATVLVLALSGCGDIRPAYYRCEIATLDQQDHSLIGSGDLQVNQGDMVLALQSESFELLSRIAGSEYAIVTVNSTTSSESWKFDQVDLGTPSEADSGFWLSVNIWPSWGFFERTDGSIVMDEVLTIQIEIPVVDFEIDDAPLVLTKIELGSISRTHWYLLGKPDLSKEYLECGT